MTPNIDYAVGSRCNLTNVPDAFHTFGFLPSFLRKELSLSINCLLSWNCELLNLDSAELVLFGRSVMFHQSELGVQLCRGLKCKY